MRAISIVLLAIALALAAATAVLAETAADAAPDTTTEAAPATAPDAADQAAPASTTAPAAATTCPPPCPPCPAQPPAGYFTGPPLAPCPTAELPASCPQPGCVVGGTGAGPGGQLANLSGTDFDASYMQYMYQQNTNIASLAGLAAQRSSDCKIKDLSAKIARERTDLNSRYPAWYAKICCDSSLTASDQCFCDLQAKLAALPCTPACTPPQACAPAPPSQFDQEYVKHMIPLMQGSLEAASLARMKACNPDLKKQANVAYRTNMNEIRALQRWWNTGFLTAKEQARYCEKNQCDPRCRLGAGPKPCP